MPEFISPDDTRYDARARDLVRIGRKAIAVENDAALDEYLAASGYAFHGPDGDMNYEQLKAPPASI